MVEESETESMDTMEWQMNRQAAEQGDMEAQYNLGLCYYNGEEVEQSYEEAVRWFRLAVEQRYENAQYSLGVCYENGEGVEQSYKEALHWYRLAAEQGDAEAQNNLGACYHEAEEWSVILKKRCIGFDLLRNKEKNMQNAISSFAVKNSSKTTLSNTAKL